jgi:hypothetical protein
MPAGSYFSPPDTLEVPMEKAEQLQFQHLPADAQYETLWRLALSGMTVDQVAARTGWSPERIRQTINPEPERALAPWRTGRPKAALRAVPRAGVRTGRYPRETRAAAFHR